MYKIATQLPWDQVSLIFTEVFDKFIEILDKFLVKFESTFDNQVAFDNFEIDMNFINEEITKLDLGQCGKAF